MFKLNNSFANALKAAKTLVVLGSGGERVSFEIQCKPSSNPSSGPRPSRGHWKSLTAFDPQYLWLKLGRILSTFKGLNLPAKYRFVLGLRHCLCRSHVWRRDQHELTDAKQKHRNQIQTKLAEQGSLFSKLLASACPDSDRGPLLKEPDSLVS